MKTFLIVTVVVVIFLGLSHLYLTNLKNKMIKARKGLANKFKNAIETDELNVLDENMESYLMLAIKGNFYKYINKLIDAGIDISLRGGAGEQAIHIAAHHSSEKVMRKLIENGADVNSLDDQNCTPLWYASQNSREDLVKIILENKAELNHQDISFKYTPLMIAAQNGGYKVVDLLLEAGADKTLKGVNKTAFEIAKNRFHANLKNQKNKKDELESMVNKLKI